MANVQVQFEDFIKKIKLGYKDENATLRERRQEVIDALREGLRETFKASGQKAPTFEYFNQGSYSLRTGVKPAHAQADYDIDVGIVLDIDPADHQDDPTLPKAWVRDALEGRTDATEISIKTPCVTVTFGDECHVDLAIYAHPDKQTTGELPLSWGRENAAIDRKDWQTNHPERLSQLIDSTFTDKRAREQFIRVLRALKRWRDLKYKHSSGHAAPVGVGLTVAGLVGWTKFQPQIDHFNGTDDDRLATELFVASLLNSFQEGLKGDKDDSYGRRLQVMLPFAPRKDVFARITNNNMKLLEERLQDLLDGLKAAGQAEGNKEACEHMRTQFGTDFPEGEDDPEDTKGSARKRPGSLPAYTGG